MKHINKLLIGLFVLSFASCGDPDLPYDEETIQNTNGAFLRVIDIPSGTYDFFNLADSEFEIEFEAFDVQKGGLLQSVDMTVRFIDNTPANGNSSTDFEDVETIPASQFSKDPDTGLPRIFKSYNAVDMMDLLGLTAADVEGQDVFQFEWTLNMTDGRSYNRHNSSNSVEGETFFSSPFIYNVNVVCQLVNGFATGAYYIEQQNAGLFGQVFADQEVELVATGNTTRTLDAVYLEQFAIGNGPMTLRFSLVCGSVLVPANQATGLGCGGNSLLIGPPNTNGDFDFSDDSEFTLRIMENTGSACGGGPVEVEFILTKL
ncbi:hypothetical protein C900_04953 [Fulvivirga imtechensis AK7]|uniref:Lipoprotein n=1 Tax=Fulvivirga imtechensis AK7 TaxID=1237149 RepID=L8JKH4_9BACT|nr:hypothetical protein [Fulvivirga imtechensis]ELR69421.1 hypothetical protein C900_04953 [Fulvivirga imtechensis AK7]